MNVAYGVMIEMFAYLVTESSIRLPTIKYNLHLLKATKWVGVSWLHFLGGTETPQSMIFQTVQETAASKCLFNVANLGQWVQLVNIVHYT